MNLIKKTSFALTLLISISLTSFADMSEWTGIYRGVGVVEQTDGKRHEIQCTLEITENPSVSLKQVLSIEHSEDSAAIQIVNLSTAPKHLKVQITDKLLAIPPLFAHPVSIKLQKEPGGFNEILITGDLVEYSVSYAQDPKIVNTLHLKLGKLK